MGNNRAAFWCPARPARELLGYQRQQDAWCDGLDGKRDPFGISESTRFSYGINDWGLSIAAKPQLGMGGDIDGSLVSRASQGLHGPCTVPNDYAGRCPGA